MGMVGGGPGSFIGPIHRMAAELDGRIEMVAGAFSSDPAQSRAAGERYGLDRDRCYADYRSLLDRERTRPDPIDFVAIVTPNHLHLPVALAALDAGFHVVSDKPATATLAEAMELGRRVRASSRHYAITYTYTGYPRIRDARALVARGELGRVRKVVVDYPQGWLADPIERSDHKQAAWRTDPVRAGSGGCIGDIGVHAFQLAEFVSGQRVRKIAADLSSVVDGRRLDDDCNVLLRFTSGQPGVLIASQISTGERNGLTLRVYGEKASLVWTHESPSELTLLRRDGTSQTFYAGIPDTTAHSRLPPGHPEGFIEAFATLYYDFAAVISGEQAMSTSLLPGIDEGIRSMRFVECAIASSRNHAGWATLDEEVEE